MHKEGSLVQLPPAVIIVHLGIDVDVHLLLLPFTAPSCGSGKPRRIRLENSLPYRECASDPETSRGRTTASRAGIERPRIGSQPSAYRGEPPEAQKDSAAPCRRRTSAPRIRGLNDRGRYST